MSKQLIRGAAAAIVLIACAATASVADPFYLYYSGPNYNNFAYPGDWGASTSTYLQAIIELDVTPTIGGGMHDYSTDIVNFVVSDGANSISDQSNYFGYNPNTQVTEEFHTMVDCEWLGGCGQSTDNAFTLELNLPSLALNDSNFLFPGMIGHFSACTEAICMEDDLAGFDITRLPGSYTDFAATYDPNDPNPVASGAGTFYSPCSAFAFPDQLPAGTFWECSVNRDAGVPGPVNVNNLVLGPTPPTISEVPEPMTLALFAAGLFGLGAARRRRKS